MTRFAGFERTFNGKKFVTSAHDMILSEAKAVSKAEFYREHGYLARIIKQQDGWVVYHREK